MAGRATEKEEIGCFVPPPWRDMRSLRGLGDRGHFKVPLWRELLKSRGMLRGTPERCAELTRSGAHALVSSGGAREVIRVQIGLLKQYRAEDRLPSWNPIRRFLAPLEA